MSDSSPPRPTSRGEVHDQAVRGIGWAVVADVGSRLIVLGMTLVLARLLVPEEFGVFAAGLSIIFYLEIVIDLGVGAALVYEQEHGVTWRVRSAFTLNLLVSFVLAIGFFLAAPWLAGIFGVADQAGVFRGLALYLVVRGAGQVNLALLQRDLNFRIVAGARLGKAIVRAALTIVLANLDYGAWSLVWGILAGELVGNVYLWLRNPVVPALRLERETSRTLLGYGAGILALRLLGEAGSNSDYLIVGARLGPTALGVYFLAYRLPEILIANALNVFSNVAFPAYSKARAFGSEAFRRGMLKALSLTTLFGFTTGVGLAVVSRDAVDVLLSDQWAGAATPMALISLSLAFGSVGFASGDIYKAIGRLGTLMLILGPIAVASAVGFWFAAPHGLIAVGIVHVVIAAVEMVIYLIVSARTTGATAYEMLQALTPAMLATAGILAFAMPLRWALPAGLVTLVAIVVAGAVGALVALLLWSRSTLEELRRLLGTMMSRA